MRRVHKSHRNESVSRHGHWSGLVRPVARDERRAFTLIELLVVIAIIALLLSVLLPSLTRAKDAAKGVICSTRLKGMSMAVFSYAEEYDETICAPWDNTTPWWNQWPYVLSYWAAGLSVPKGEDLYNNGWYHPSDGSHHWPAPHWGTISAGQPSGFETMPMMFCPTMHDRRIGAFGSPDAYANRPMTSWSMGTIAKNRWGNYSIRGWIKLAKMTHPSATMILTDYASTSEDPEKLAPWTHHGCFRIDPHLDKSNYLYLDGHVEPLADDETTERLFQGEGPED
jgi:prepilin-type N-terminal cleavage/methylation domain-containing protein/prepilin-type processing-associated H-X9-DG protein